MRKSDITYIVSSVFAAMAAFFYCCTMWFTIKLPYYYPLEHTWKWAKEKGVPFQGWYGKQAFAFLAAAAAALIVYFLIKRIAPRELNLKPALTKLLGVVVTVIVVLCMGYILCYEFNRWGIFGP